MTNVEGKFHLAVADSKWLCTFGPGNAEQQSGRVNKRPRSFISQPWTHILRPTFLAWSPYLEQLLLDNCKLKDSIHVLELQLPTMDSPTFKVPASPGTPLFPISPERMNQQKFTASPSLPSDLAELAKSPSRHNRNFSTASDVQSKVAAFNQLTRETSSQRLATDAALKRAIVGREEAESELHGARAQLSEARNRERRVGERLESLFEELATSKERQTHERAVFEKEVRRARKEAFKAGSTLVKVQEELKAAREDARGLKEQLRTEKTSRANAEQANFEMEYKLTGMTEELNTLREQIKAMGEEKKSEQIVKDLGDQSETQMVTVTQEEMDAFWDKIPQESASHKSSSRKNRFTRQASPREDAEPEPSGKWRFPGRRSFKPNFDSDESEGDEDDIDMLKSQLRQEKRQRESAEQMVHFLKMECQFQRCSCRIAEAQGTRYVHDHEWDMEVQRMERERQEPAEAKPAETNDQIDEELESTQIVLKVQPDTQGDAHEGPDGATEPLIGFSPTTGTFHTIISPAVKESHSEEPLEQICEDVSSEPAPSVPDDLEPRTPSTMTAPIIPLSSPVNAVDTIEESEQLSSAICSPVVSPEPVRVPTVFATPSAKSSRPLQMTPHRAPYTTAAPTRIITNTITMAIPLAVAADDVFSPAERATPITREQALEQIRARRGRARSFVLNGAGVRRGLLGGTPGKEERRDISAPAGKC
jgi:hypothetical protein